MRFDTTFYFDICSVRDIRASGWVTSHLCARTAHPLIGLTGVSLTYHLRYSLWPHGHHNLVTYILIMIPLQKKILVIILHSCLPWHCNRIIALEILFVVLASLCLISFSTLEWWWWGDGDCSCSPGSHFPGRSRSFFLSFLPSFLLSFITLFVILSFLLTCVFTFILSHLSCERYAAFICCFFHISSIEFYYRLQSNRVESSLAFLFPPMIHGTALSNSAKSEKK